MTQQNRSLGIGFGPDNHFYIRLNEPNEMMINKLPLSDAVMEELKNKLQIEFNVAKAKKKQLKLFGAATNNHANFGIILSEILQKHQAEKTSAEIEEIVSNALALIIPDILADVNITRLNEHILPKAMQDNDIKNLLGSGLSKFFMFDDGLNFSVGIGNNNASIYKSEIYFNYANMHDENNDSIRQEAQAGQRFLKSLVVSKYIKDFGIPENIKIIENEIQAIKNNLGESDEAKAKTKELEMKIDAWKNQITKDQLAVIYHDLTGKIPKSIELSKINPKINLQDNDVYAYLVPAIMDRMSDEDLKKASSRMVNYLSITDFKPVGLPNYDKVNLKLVPQEADITNANRRSLQIFAQPNNQVNDDSGLDFRGKTYKFQHTHIHFEKDGEEKEFVVQDKNGKTINFEGEVHSVFEYTPEKHKGNPAQKRLVAVHYPLKVVVGDNAENKDVAELLANIDMNKQQWNDEIKKWESRENKNDNTPKPRLHLEKLLDFGKVFLKSLNEQSEQGELLHHSWASLRSSTHGFKSGLRFIISKQPIEVSEEQYNKLKTLFGEMRKDLKEEEILDPIDRKAGWRKPRMALLEELTHSMPMTPALQMR